MHDLPGSLRLTSTFPFVGRAAELETLAALLPLGEREGRRVVLLGGEPGSGKSRLVRELSARAAGEGVLVVYGACDAVVRTPYGPWVEALDHLVRVADPDELRTALGPAGGELTRLLPNLPARVGPLPPPVAADPDTERHRLHTAVTDLLAGLGRRPLLLVLEDGHWADAPTLLLLRHLTRAAGHARVLLLATFRDTEADVPDVLATTLADLRRSDDVVRLRLEGLSHVEVGEFVRRAAGPEATSGAVERAGTGGEAPQLAGAIRQLTGGNPFLVCELWRALVETRQVQVVDGGLRLTRPLADLGTPASVREVVSQRLARLSPGTSGVLELMAAAGPEFGLGLVRSAAGLAEPELLAALDEAMRSGMIEELESPLLTYRFTHELVRRALYDRLTGVRRAELHLRVGEALERGADRSARTLADLAHHFAAGAPFDGPERAEAYSVLAARAAAAGLAYDEATVLLRQALELGPREPRERAELFLELGALCHRAGKAVDALEAFRQAGAIARELGDGALLARAAIGFEDACWRPGITDQGAAELLEEAAARLGPERSPLRVGLLSGLARALGFQGDQERAAVVRTEAVAMARELDERKALGTTLARAYWSRGGTSLRATVGMLTEARAIGLELGDTELVGEAMAWRIPAFVALCEMDAARDEVAALLETAEDTAQPFMHHVAEHYGSALALCDGRLWEAEDRAARSNDWSRVLTGRDPSGIYGFQMFSVRREQGRLAELAAVIRILTAQDRRGGPWRPGLVSVLVELGMEHEARRVLADAVADGLEPFRESLWLAALTYLTDAAAALGDERTAALVYPELLPLSGGNVMIGHLVSCYGAADRYLGMLATTLGDWDRAEAHFERAMELNRRMGAFTWLAHTAHAYAELLHARRTRADDRRALLAQAAALGERIGMPALLARIHAGHADAPVRQAAGGPRADPDRDDLSSRELQILALVARGLTNREIGGRLFISEHTAANHIRSILRKTGSANRTEAASYAHRHGLVGADGAR